jgi:hypothetical protein
MTVFVSVGALNTMMFLDLCIRIPSAFIGFLSAAKFLVVSIITHSYKEKMVKIEIQEVNNEESWNIIVPSCP